MANNQGRKVSDGKSVRVICPDGSTCLQGEFALLQGFFGFNLTAEKSDPAGDVPVILQIEQAEYETTQLTAADAFAVGAPVYFDPATKLLTATAGALRAVGTVTVAKDSGGSIWMLLAPQRATA